MADSAGADQVRGLHTKLMLTDLLLLLLLVGAATGSLARLVTAERGPGAVLYRLRVWMRSRTSRIGQETAQALSCAICAGTWIATILSVYVVVVFYVFHLPVLLLPLLPFAAAGIGFALTGMGNLWAQPHEK